MGFVDDARRSVPAAIRLYRFDASALSEFDFSFDGFIRSFGVLLPVALVYLALTRVEFGHLAGSGAADLPEPMAFYGWKLAGLVIDWFAFPLIMVPICKALGLGARYVMVIVALNWMAIVAIAIWAAPAFLFSLGLAGPSAAALLSMVAFFYVVAVTGFAIRTTLEVNPGIAVALTVLYLLIGLVVGALADRMNAG